MQYQLNVQFIIIYCYYLAKYTLFYEYEVVKHMFYSNKSYIEMFSKILVHLDQKLSEEENGIIS